MDAQNKNSKQYKIKNMINYTEIRFYRRGVFTDFESSRLDRLIRQGKIREHGILDGMMHYVVDWEDGTTQVTAALASEKYYYSLR